jgi:hypothetical protein
MLERLNRSFKKDLNKKDFKKSNKDFRGQSEHGSSTTKFVLVVIALFLIGYGGYNYIVLSYQCSHFKEKVQEIITQAYSLQNNKTLNDPELMRQKIRSLGDYDNVPADALITVTKKPTGLEAQVVFTRETNLLPFGMYRYKYQFNNTIKPPTMFEVR